MVLNNVVLLHTLEKMFNSPSVIVGVPKIKTRLLG